MNLKPIAMVRVALFALIMLHAPAAQAGEEAPYPIWWSPELELESLDQIRKRKDRKFWAGSGGIPVAKSYRPEEIEAFIDNCSSYDKLSSEGYFALKNIDSNALRYQTSICRALDELAVAKPSHRSYVNQFKFDEDSIAYLPAMLPYPGSYDFACRQFVANERRISWKDFEVSEFQEIEIIHETEMKVLTTDWLLTLQIIARADFNDDGLEDLMLRINEGAVGGSFRDTSITLITRDSPDSIFWVIGAEKSLDPNYVCNETYDYPDALRDTN